MGVLGLYCLLTVRTLIGCTNNNQLKVSQAERRNTNTHATRFSLKPLRLIDTRCSTHTAGSGRASLTRAPEEGQEACVEGTRAVIMFSLMKRCCQVLRRSPLTARCLPCGRAHFDRQYRKNAPTCSPNKVMLPRYHYCTWVPDQLPSPTLPEKMPFRVAISTAPDHHGSGRVDILTHPYKTAACAAGVGTGTADRDSSRYRYSGNRRTRQLALDCEGN